MTAASLAPGSLFAGDFEIVKPLRAGGMGSVYVARQVSTGKPRALKLMHAELVADPELRRRFDQEARIASLIASDHVVEVVGAGVDDASGAPWLAMELLDGRDLDSEISELGPMSLRDAHRVLRQICHALAAAHAAGIIHRDLKPENVFLARSKSVDEAVSVKVLDFGIAKIAAEAATKNTAALGSPIWMAPEQTERGAVTPSADVWAIGLVAFFLLTGRVFWVSASTPGGTVQQVMREVLFGPIPAASARAAELGERRRLPPWFDAWFAGCVTRAPEQRFPNAAKAFAAFDRLSDSPAGGLPLPGLTHATYDTGPSGYRGELGGSGDVVVSSAHPAIASWPTEVAPPPTGGTPVRATLDRPIAETTVVENAKPVVRPGFLVAVGLVVAVAIATVVHYRNLFAGETTDARPSREAPAPNLPPDLASTDGAAWFTRIKTRCNPVEVGVLLQQDPPPKSKDGAGFAAACYAISGKIDRARATLDAVDEGDRPWAAYCVFEVVHPIADAGDDASAGPAMRLVLEYWPDNYMALYHAGMSEFATQDPKNAKKHLERFLSVYQKPDGFTASAKRVLAELSGAPSSPPDCRTPLTTDPEGRKIYPAGCGKPG